MYRDAPTMRDRAGTLALVALIHAGIGYGLLNLSGAGAVIADQADLAIFDVLLPTPSVPPPPPPPPPPQVEQASAKQARPKQAEGASSPRNIRSKATEVVVPEPRIVLPAPSPVVAAITAGTGANASSGAADVRGPGTGAGGTGIGTGSGAGGSGSGGGGGGGGGGPPSRPTVVERTKLTSRDYPPAAIRAWPRGASVDVAVRVQLDGRATDCKVNRSSGSPGIDADTCRLVMERVRFTPARDDAGRPYVDWYGYRQRAEGRW